MALPLVVGASVLCVVNGQVYGQATSCQWTHETPDREFFGLDDPHAQESGPTVERVSGTVSVLRLEGDGGAEGTGLVAADEPARVMYGTLAIVSRRTGRNLLLVEGVRLRASAWQINAKGQMTGTLTFVSVDPRRPEA